MFSERYAGPASSAQRARNASAIGAIVLLALGVRCWELTAPLGKTWEVPVLEVYAQSLLRHGFLETRMIPTTGVHEGEIFVSPSGRHPHLVPLLLTASFAVFGVAEWSARLVPILFSTASVAILYYLLLPAFGARGARMAALVAAVVPAAAYFGRLGVHGPVLIFFVLVSVYLFRDAVEAPESERRPDEGDLARLATVGFFGANAGWLYFFVLPALFLYAALRARLRRALVLLGMLGTTCGAVGVANLLFYRMIVVPHRPGGRSDFASALLHRIDSGPLYFADAERLLHVAVRFATLFTPLVFLLVPIWLAAFSCRVRRGRVEEQNALVASLFIYGALIYLVCAQWAHVHQFSVYHLVPGFVAAMAWIMSKARTSLAILALAVIVGSSLVVLRQLHHGLNPEGHRLGMQVARHAEPGDMMIWNAKDVPLFYASLPTRVIEMTAQRLTAALDRYHPAFVGYYKSIVEGAIDREEVAATLADRGYVRWSSSSLRDLWVSAEKDAAVEYSGGRSPVRNDL